MPNSLMKLQAFNFGENLSTLRAWEHVGSRQREIDHGATLVAARQFPQLHGTAVRGGAAASLDFLRRLIGGGDVHEGANPGAGVMDFGIFHLFASY